MRSYGHGSQESHSRGRGGPGVHGMPKAGWGQRAPPIVNTKLTERVTAIKETHTSLHIPPDYAEFYVEREPTVLYHRLTQTCPHTSTPACPPIEAEKEKSDCEDNYLSVPEIVSHVETDHISNISTNSSNQEFVNL